MMKDKIRILKDFSAFDYKCHFCHKQTHLFFECPKIHYIPDRDFLIKKMNHQKNLFAVGNPKFYQQLRFWF